jgi:hypothetical protein
LLIPDRFFFNRPGTDATARTIVQQQIIGVSN